MADHRDPMRGGGGQLGAALMQLGEADARHQMLLVDGQDMLERLAFALVIAGEALCHRQVHP